METTTTIETSLRKRVMDLAKIDGRRRTCNGARAVLRIVTGILWVVSLIGVLALIWIHAFFGISEAFGVAIGTTSGILGIPALMMFLCSYLD